MNDILLITLTFVLAGFVKGVIGLGLPTIAMGVLGLWLAPAQAAALLLAPSFVTNIVQMQGPGLGATWRRLAPMLLGVVLGTLGGWWLWGGLGGSLASAGLGAALAGYGVIGLLALRPRFSPPTLARLGLPVGAMTGAITAGTGVFVIPAVPWLQASGLAKNDLVQALGMAFFVSTLALGALLGVGGNLGGGVVWGSVAALVPALLGQWLGTALRQRLPEAGFRKCFFLALILLGLHLLWRALT